FDRREHRDAARVTELERRARVDRVEHVLDRDAVRPALEQQCGQPRMDVQEFFRERSFARSADGAAGDDAMARAVGFNASVAGAIGAGVDTENLHASDASISFSEMSKLPDTFCTSS